MTASERAGIIFSRYLQLNDISSSLQNVLSGVSMNSDPEDSNNLPLETSSGAGYPAPSALLLPRVEED